MKVHVLTLFPDLINAYLSTSTIRKAIEKQLLVFDVKDIRDYTLDTHNHVDDYPFGGGAGMLIEAQPIIDCFESIPNCYSLPVYYLSPRGKTLNQDLAQTIAKNEEIILLCGHYEGVDERALIIMKATEISIGDYVLTGGEIPACVLIDTVSRFVPGVLSNSESGSEESFTNQLLEYPQYTRPQNFRGLEVPEILLSGDHKKIRNWRLEQSIELTKNNRPDLYEEYLKNNPKL